MLGLLETVHINLMLIISIALILIFFLFLIFFPSKDKSKNKSIGSSNEAVDKKVNFDKNNQNDFEDFMIFKKDRNDENLDKFEKKFEDKNFEVELLNLESKMLKLKDLFSQGLISKNDYVDKTRNLYEEAKSLVGNYTS